MSTIYSSPLVISAMADNQTQQLTFILAEPSDLPSCEFCHKPFTPRVHWQKFCPGGKCRQKANYYRHHEENRLRENQRRRVQGRKAKTTKPLAEKSQPIAEMDKPAPEPIPTAAPAVDVGQLLTIIQQQQQQIDQLINLVALGKSKHNPDPVSPLDAQSSKVSDLPDFEIAKSDPEKGKAYANYMRSLSGLNGKSSSIVKPTQKPTSKPKVKRQEPPLSDQDTRLLTPVIEGSPRKIVGADKPLSTPSFDDLSIDF